MGDVAKLHSHEPGYDDSRQSSSHRYVVPNFRQKHLCSCVVCALCAGVCVGHCHDCIPMHRWVEHVLKFYCFTFFAFLKACAPARRLRTACRRRFVRAAHTRTRHRCTLHYDGATRLHEDDR